MIDTSELGAGANPTPVEKKARKIKGKIIMEYEIEDEFPSDWSREQILEYIKDNLDYYANYGNVVEVDI